MLSSVPPRRALIDAIEQAASGNFESAPELGDRRDLGFS